MDTYPTYPGTRTVRIAGLNVEQSDNLLYLRHEDIVPEPHEPEPLRLRLVHMWWAACRWVRRINQRRK